MAISESLKVKWWSGLVWVSIATGLLVVGIAFSSFKEKAYHYYWLDALSFLPIVLGFIDVAYRFIWNGFSGHKCLNIAIMLTMWGVFTISKVLEERIIIQNGLKYLIESGKLNPRTAEWDLNAPWHISNRKDEERKIARLKAIWRLSPLMPPLGIFISRYFSIEIEYLFIVLIFYTLSISMSWVMGQKFSLCLVLREWEKGSGKVVKIKRVYVDENL